jgi:hypothetical protein
MDLWSSHLGKIGGTSLFEPRKSSVRLAGTAMRKQATPYRYSSQPVYREPLPSATRDSEVKNDYTK